MREIRTINPLDLQSRKAVGVALPFSAAAVFNSTFNTKDAVKTNLINFLLTGRYERFMNIGFGAGLRELLFENISIDRLQIVKEFISDRISLNFPNVTITQFNIEASPDLNTIQVYFKYLIKRTGVNDEILINIEE